MPEVAVYAVVYPAAKRFFGEFWSSLEPQVADGFEVCLSLDGVSEDEIMAVTGSSSAVRFISGPETSGGGQPSPIDTRRHALTTLTAEYSAVVLLDSDDVLLPGRLEAARRSVADYDVYACALRIVDEATVPVPVPDFTLEDDELEELRYGALLAKVNAIGFGNSAYRSEVLSACLDVPSDALLMDWLVASRAHLMGASFTFDTVPRMLYRQYGANTASVVAPFSARRILSDTRRVVEHYQTLLSTPHGSLRSVEPFERARARVEGFLAWLEEPGQGDDRNLTDYVGLLNALPKRTFLWWQHIAMDLPGPVHGTPIRFQKEEGTV